MNHEIVRYDDAIVRKFAIVTIIWGVVGMLAGLWLALELASHEFNLGLEWISFGRLRPLHTNAVIFAFVGNAMFAGIYYSTQRLLKTRMASDTLSSINFWGWQAIIVAAAVTLPLGITTSKEYAELEWPIDIGIALIWVVFGINFFMTLVQRREKHLYVAIWFYIASIIAVALLHIVNSLAVPVGLDKSYSVFAGVQDALVQWWYGHNAVAFFLTTPFLGLMYYFVPKAAKRPVYSYRLSIIHFWALVFLYIWAGPHHLLNSALPDWAQSLGTVFSIMLIAPSWGGMINGLLTLRGAWDTLRTDPVMKFFVAAITFYGMATFEGPMMSLKSVNSLSHYTNWTIAHVHAGGLGWNGFFTFGLLYWLLPRLWRTQLHSIKLATAHFWFGLAGIGLYVFSMWVAGVTEGLMWKEFDADGRLVYGAWDEMVPSLFPLYAARAGGGVLYLVGVTIMCVNLLKTWQTRGSALDTKNAEELQQAMDETVVELPVPEKTAHDEGEAWHRRLEGKPLAFTLWVVVAVAAGGILELIPTIAIRSNVPTIASVQPYTPLEQAGRDLYIREGCSNCHSQMVRPFREETIRYGEYSKAGEYVYDRPFLWGSRRIGPDLHRVGQKYPHLWHYNHLVDPRSTSPASLMPEYDHLLVGEVDFAAIAPKLEALATLGVPYSVSDIGDSAGAARAQADTIVTELEAAGVEGLQAEHEIVALIAYLQRLGTDIKGEK
ncbi:MAG: cytochrome-c oxidase, cbb3-type subunit I [Myxococcales bacterium FL481]|nr:MAG: cytochrome-c oxidase, cbb3-type subunit I [Myxococcales bacterium FL481]